MEIQRIAIVQVKNYLGGRFYHISSVIHAFLTPQHINVLKLGITTLN